MGLLAQPKCRARAANFLLVLLCVFFVPAEQFSSQIMMWRLIVIRCLGSMLVSRLFLSADFFPKFFKKICASGFSLEGVWDPPL